MIVATPLPEEQLQFEPGDVLGVYVSSALAKGSGIALISSDRENRSLEEDVWYARVDKQEVEVGDSGQDCPEAETFLDTYVNAVPAIAVSINIAGDNGKNNSMC